MDFITLLMPLTVLAIVADVFCMRIEYSSLEATPSSWEDSLRNCRYVFFSRMAFCA